MFVADRSAFLRRTLRRLLCARACHDPTQAGRGRHHIGNRCGRIAASDDRGTLPGPASHRRDCGPKSYRGTGAPQAIEQAGLFGPYAEGALDIDVESPINVWEVPASSSRPTHLNLCLDEPLDGEIEGIDFAAIPSNRPGNHTPSEAKALARERLRVQNPDLVVVAGVHPDDAAVLAPALRSFGVPVFAEATANLGAHRELTSLLIPPTDSTITGLRPRSILRIGAVPSGRWWRDLEDQPGTRVLNLTQAGLPGIARAQNVTTAKLDTENVARLLISESASGQDATVSALEPPATQRRLSNEQAWLGEIAEIIPSEALVFLGNSLPIREWNAVVGSSRPFRTFANRGANGIDGLVSTFLGLAADEPESWLILGDLSALYDLAAPWILGQLPEANRRIVILNNGGGRIFSKVASLQKLPPETRAMLENDHGLSFAPWAALWGLPYQLAQDPGDLSDLPDGPRVIEIQTQA